MRLRINFASIRNHTVFTKFLGNMFMVLIIPFLILMIMYFGLNLKIREQTYERNLEILRNSVQKIEMLFDNMDQIAFFLNDNVNIINYYNADTDSIKKHTTDMIKAQKDLGAIKVGNNDIINIQLYSELSDTLIDYFTNALYFERYYGSSFYAEGMNGLQFRESYLEQKSNMSYSQLTVTATGTTNEALVYNKFHTGINVVRGNNRIIFYVSRDKMLNFFTPLDYQEEGFVCVTDENGQVILCDNSAEYDLEQLDSSMFKGDGGYITQNLNGRKMFVTYYRSEARNWWCLEAVPVSSVLAVTNGFRTGMLCLLILAAITGMVLVLLVAIKLSKPIAEVSDILGRREKKVPMEDFVEAVKSLVEHNTVLTEKMQQQISVMRTEAFYRLLVGDCRDEATIMEVLDKIEINQKASHYVILLVVCNDINVDAQLEEISVQKVFLENIIREQEYCEIQDIYHIDFERMIIFMASEDTSARQVRERAENLIKDVMEVIEKNAFYSISVGGEIVDDALRLPKAFIHAQRALSVPQNVFGLHRVQWYVRAKQYLEMETHDFNIQEENFISLQNLVLVEQIKEYIKDNYKDPQLSLSSVGEEFCITEVYLSKLFKRATKDNFSKYIEGLRMGRAKELIEQNIKVAEVAELVGYNSPQVFRRAWKRTYGGIPSDNVR